MVLMCIAAVDSKHCVIINIHTCVSQYHRVGQIYYSEISNSGHSGQSLYERTQLEAPNIFLPTVQNLIRLIQNLSKKTTSLQRTKETVPKCPLFGDSIHCIYIHSLTINTICYIVYSVYGQYI